MVSKNGIYLSVDGDNAVRVIIENNTKIQTDKIKLSDELIGELGYDLSNYETTVKYISEKTEPLDELGTTYSEEQFSAIVDASLDVADGVRENDLPAGILLIAAINKLLDTPDNGTAMYWLQTMHGIVTALQEPLDTRYILALPQF